MHLLVSMLVGHNYFDVEGDDGKAGDDGALMDWTGWTSTVLFVKSTPREAKAGCEFVPQIFGGEDSGPQWVSDPMM